MSILIKGMEMPDSCFLCRFCRRQEYGEYVGEDTAWSCVASKKRITDGQDLIATFKHPDCPLVEAAEVQNDVSRQAAIDARRYTFGNDEFNLEYAYHDCKLVFDGITDDDSFIKADTGLILYYANEIIYALQEALEGKDTNVQTNDCIRRQAVVDLLDEYMGRLCIHIGTLDDTESYSYARGLLVGMINNIKHLRPAQPERQWIPIWDGDGQMPEVDEDGCSEYVLLSFGNASFVCIGRYQVDEDGGAFYDGDKEDPLTKIGLFVNAWMPLPEPYKPPTRSKYRRMQEQKGEQE